MNFNVRMAELLRLIEGLRHTVPDRPYSIVEAHEAMRDHIECRADICPAKGAALDTLVLAARIRPNYDKYRR